MNTSMSTNVTSILHEDGRRMARNLSLNSMNASESTSTANTIYESHQQAVARRRNTSNLTNISSMLHKDNQRAAKNRSFLIWMPINLIILSFILSDIWKPQSSSISVLILEYLLALILSMNILYLCCQRFLNQYFAEKYNISFQQFNLMKRLNIRIKEESNLNVLYYQSGGNDEGRRERVLFEKFCPSMLSRSSNAENSKHIFPDSSKTDQCRKESLPLSPITFSSTPIISDVSRNSSLLNASTDSCLGSSANHERLSNSLFAASKLSKSYSFLEEDSVDGVGSGRKSTDSIYRRTQDTSAAADASGDWIRSDIFHRDHLIPRNDLVLNGAYQLSRIAASESEKQVNEVSSLSANSTACKQFGVNPAHLPEWIANLRMWISQTILNRIINEIEEVNSLLTAHGAANVSIGSSGLERLKKAAGMSHISSNIPTLSSLISFLDISTNQEYIVKRIKELATGSMSNYCWNSGGMYEGRPWNETLPTDAALVMHLVAAYFDSQVFPLPQAAPDGRQFSSAHFVKTPATPLKNKKSLIVFQQRMHPPHFQLIVGDEVYDISWGRNNLFHVILFFLQHVKTKESGMFEHVNLGSSGINMLWIINEPAPFRVFKKLQI